MDVLDEYIYIGYNEYIITIGGLKVKPWTFRMPDELLDWLREKAAKETIKRKKSVSMNTMAIEIFTKAKEKDRKEGK
jgi:hypothetical protein